MTNRDNLIKEIITNLINNYDELKNSDDRLIKDIIEIINKYLDNINEVNLKILKMREGC